LPYNIANAQGEGFSLLERFLSFALHIGYGKAAIEPAVLSHGPSPELEGKLPSTLAHPERRRETTSILLPYTAAELTDAYNS